MANQKKWKHSKDFRAFLARRLLAENGCSSGARQVQHALAHGVFTLADRFRRMDDDKATWTEEERQTFAAYRELMAKNKEG